MAHIHTNPGHHDFTASGYIIRLDTPEPAILLHFHRKINKYLQFGGHVELDENPWDTVRHELREESGYDLDQLQLLQPAEQLHRTSHGIMHPTPAAINTHPFSTENKHFHTDLGYAFVTSQAPRNSVAGGESTRFKLYTREELAALPDDAVPPSVREIGIYIFDVLLPRWQRIDPAMYERGQA